MSACCCGIALEKGHVAQTGERLRHAPCVPQSTAERQAFLEEHTRPLVVTLFTGQTTQIPERRGDLTLVLQLPFDSEALFEEQACRGVVALVVGQVPQVME